jgi:hypothetical protein
MAGKKNLLTDGPTERVDQQILEVLLELDPGSRLPIGLRVTGSFEHGIARRDPNRWIFRHPRQWLS